MPPCANIHTMCSVPSHEKASPVEYEFVSHLSEAVMCAESPVVPPCGHNDWDNQRVKRKVIMLKCRQCQKKWKTPLNNLRRCSRYLKDACNLGEDCKLLHIHKYKNPQKEADKRAKRCDERARIKLGRAKRSCAGADAVPVLGDACDELELSLPNDTTAPLSSHESDTGSAASAAASSTMLSADTIGASSTLSLPDSQHIVAHAAAQMAAVQQQQQAQQAHPQFFLPSQGATTTQGTATQVMLGMGLPMGFPQVSMLQGIPMLIPAANANGFAATPALQTMDMYTQAALQTQMLASMCQVTTGYSDLVQPATVALNNAPVVVIQNPMQMQTIGNLL